MPTATNLNCYGAEGLEKLPPNTVLISFNEEDRALYPLKLNRDSDSILTLRVSDVTSKLEHKGVTYYPISDYNCLQILDFINRHNGKHFIVHCAAGLSRSTAVCLYLHIAHGYDLPKGFWKIAYPNRYILGGLFLNRHKKYE